MSVRENTEASPIGRSATEVAGERAERSEEYRNARKEYAAIRELRERNPLAAHIRERRYELGLTQQQVAEQAGTAHSFIARIEKGNHYPTIAVLKRILAVLDEEIIITVVERGEGAEAERSDIAVPELVAA
jgi:DNA-binding XRE family transcriptional regulator